MNTPTEPEGGIGGKEVLTRIKAANNAGNHWAVDLEHNGKKYPIPKEGLDLHINGGAVRIHGIDVTRKVQKGIENIFQHDAWTGSISIVEPMPQRPFQPTLSLSFAGQIVPNIDMYQY